MNQFFFLSIPFILTLLFSFLPTKLWFDYLDQTIVISVTLFFFSFHALTFIFQRPLANTLSSFENVLNRNRTLVLLGFFLFMLCFPFRNLNWGDGIILLETNLLETELFGSQIAMDEILETISHSLAFRILSIWNFDDDNRYAYQIVSFLSGAIFLAFLGWKLNSGPQKRTNLFESILFLGSSGFLVFFGYAENYSILSLFIFLFIFYVRQWIQTDLSPNVLLINSTLLVTLGIYLHLVSGFLIISLFYLWIEFSPKNKRWNDLIKCSFIGGIILLLGFCYLLFLHDPTLDRKSSHLLHPPIYPWKRLISLNHLTEITAVMWYNSRVPLLILAYFYFFERSILKSFFQKKENKFILSVIVSFLVNGFIINPMLGFPSDWDMIGFYWIPFAFLGYHLLTEHRFLIIKFASVLLFTFTIQILQARHLNYLDEAKNKEVLLTQKIVHEYVSENRIKISGLPRTEKKFYAKTDFFFYKSIQISRRICEFTGKNELINTLQALQKEFQEGTDTGKLNDKIWIKDFLTKATITNTAYIKSLKEYNLCHLEL
ncbi:dolichyl-phosphate-mannose--protein mannosyltransferase [Leptospira ognonensis]|uniref:Dolichyl-phosphate-mannose--protein mannosyltransferase n=1 Tax=Leptospira ognonensis TaxID=2484945 RepID=A0A4R9K114_9LEPT|nr:dolichyl-phosphate-mannose--protein mannosyltransferase [Leptospira ognonensis]TGL59372.1 dolichyl-phosphate-mannose--protein mannosyltransferase [Leptospira ognonensis]